MAEDKEILRELWNGRLPVCFKLAADECGSTEPEELYLMVPRHSYFPLVYDRIHKHFDDHVESTHRNNEIWLEYDDKPLKGHYQVGLLYDLYANEGPNGQFNLPWSINVHYQNYPDDLFHFNKKELLESYFMSTIKEADALKHKEKVINKMQKKDQNQLWFGLQNDKFDQFWSINKKLMEITEGEAFKSIPFRIYQSDKALVQKLFEPVGENGKRKTLSDLLETIFGPEHETANKLVLIQGVTPSMETPIQWLSEHLSYPDNFLHICVK